MGKPTGFIELPRVDVHKRPVEERIRDWNEIYLPPNEKELREQGARCMDCGVPFCNSHHGCPLGNIIPEWNDLVYRGRWREAYERLAATNNFPEWTGRLCPAPCESACVLAIPRLEDAVTIKSIELTIVERAFAEGWIRANPPSRRTGKTVAIIGSGPAGLAAADQLNRVGHTVTVLERSDRIGGLLRYGIPEFKMEKQFLDRRLKLLTVEGVIFRTNAEVGGNVSAADLLSQYDAVLLAAGALWGRDIAVPGRELAGIHQAMEYLTQANQSCQGDTVREPISAAGKHVIILGGGDTGADCLGTAVRQGAKSIRQWDYNIAPPEARSTGNPWPEWARVMRHYGAHEEADTLYGAQLSPRVGIGGDPDGIREWQVFTEKFTSSAAGAAAPSNGVKPHVTHIHGFRGRWRKQSDGKRTLEKEPNSQFCVPADLVLLAIGFRGTDGAESGSRSAAMLRALGVELNPNRGTVVVDSVTHATSNPKVFAAGDMTRGASLIVWAIAEGRTAARGIDTFLMGGSDLPTPDFR